jgi:hypothetical protein
MMMDVRLKECNRLRHERKFGNSKMANETLPEPKETTAQEGKTVLITIDVKQCILFIERSVANAEARFTTRALKTISSLRSKLTTTVLQSILTSYFTSGIYLHVIFTIDHATVKLLFNVSLLFNA